MSLLSSLFSAVYGLFSHEFSLFGFAFSFLQVMLFSAAASMVLVFVRRFLD